MHSAFQVSAGIAKYGIHLGQHQFNRCFAQNGSIRELAKEETSGFNTPRRDRLAHSSCLLVDVIPGQVCTDYPSFLLSSGILHMLHTHCHCHCILSSITYILTCDLFPQSRRRRPPKLAKQHGVASGDYHPLCHIQSRTVASGVTLN